MAAKPDEQALASLAPLTSLASNKESGFLSFIRISGRTQDNLWEKAFKMLVKGL